MIRPRAAAATLLCLTLLQGCASLPIRLPWVSRESGDWTPGTAQHEVAGTGSRTFLLHVPPQQPRGRFGFRRAFPLIIALHGSSGTPSDVQQASRFDSIADVDHFLVAYPAGSRGHLALHVTDWNAGSCCGQAAREGLDDLGFINAVIARVERELPVDRRRVYVAGFSDGGRMAYRIACDDAKLVAAIAVVAGSLVDPSCHPARPVPVIAFHATTDPEVPYDDSALTAPPHAPSPAIAALPSSIRFWAVEDGCTGASDQPLTAHASRIALAPCTAADVVLYRILGGTHGWPGEPHDASDAPSPMWEIDASDLIVRFFLAHPRGRPLARPRVPADSIARAATATSAPSPLR